MKRKNMLKKLIAPLLTVLISISLVTASVSAAELPSVVPTTNVEKAVAIYKTSNTSNTISAEDIVKTAKELIGYPYVSGGESPSEGGFDCTGLVYYVYHTKLGYDMTLEQARSKSMLLAMGTKITNKADLLPGDIIQYTISHISIYIGNNSVIHAGSSKGVCQIPLNLAELPFSYGIRLPNVTQNGEPESTPPTPASFTVIDNPDSSDYAHDLLGERLFTILHSGISGCVSPSLPAVGGTMDTTRSYTTTYANQSGSSSDYQCVAYARAAYSYLFGYNCGDSTYRVDFPAKGAASLSCQQFNEWGVRCGAYLRTTDSSAGTWNPNVGHSLLILGYNDEWVTTLEGNYSGGKIGVLRYTWEQFNSYTFTGRSRYVCSFSQPTEDIYETLDPIPSVSYEVHMTYSPHCIYEVDELETGWVNITTYLEEGYRVASVAVTKSDGTPVSVAEITENYYSFVMPDMDVWVVVTCEETGGLTNFVPSNSYNNNFDDVSKKEWYYNNVVTAYNYGLMKGASSTKFNVTGNVSVAEAITMACRLHSIFYTGTENFPQTGGVWYQIYVDYAASNGLTTHGYDSYTRSTTRAEFAELFANAFPADALTQINKLNDGGIPDVPMSASYANAVYTLYRAGILVGSDANRTFHPTSTISRVEAAAIVTRMANQDLRQHF